MLVKNKKFIFAGFLTVILIFGLFQIALAVVPSEVTEGLVNTAKEAKISTGGNVTNLIGNVIGGILSFIGVIFFALMVFGGFMWMTARGNEEQTKKALGTVTSAVIGLVIVLSSYAITNVVFQNTYLKPTPVATGGESTIDPKDVACDTAHKGWRCGDIDKCSEYGKSIHKGDVFNPKDPDVEVIAQVCLESGKNSCLFSSETSGDPLCATTEGSPVQVCCQPQDESQKKYDWCFVLETGKCEKLDSYGPGNCPDQAKRENGNVEIPGDAKTLVIKDSTEKECLMNLSGTECKDDSICQTSVTGLVCGVVNSNSPNGPKRCIEPAGVGEKPGEGDACKSTSDCKTGVCKNINKTSGIGRCEFLTANCTENTVLSGLMCGAKACGQKDEDVLCTANSQCQSKHCVNNKCESGLKGSSCESSSDCGEGYFCTTRGTPSCCLKKLNSKEKCYGNNEACLSKVCVDEPGLEDVCE